MSGRMEDGKIFSDKLRINRLYLEEKIEKVINELLIKIQGTGLLQINEIRRISGTPVQKGTTSRTQSTDTPPLTPTSTKSLLARLNIRDRESFQKFIDCLRDVKLDDVADLLERDGVVVKVVVHHQTTVDVSSPGTRLVSKLNNINNYQSSRKKKVEKIINSLKEEDIEIVEASQLNESGLVVWMCCWSADGLSELKSKFKSGDLFDLFRKLFNCMSFAQVEKVDISSLQLYTDDEELQSPPALPSQSCDGSQNSDQTQSPVILRRLIKNTSESNKTTSEQTPNKVSNVELDASNQTPKIPLRPDKLQLPESNVINEQSYPVSSDQSTSIMNKILVSLGMTKYYPNKLSWIDIVTIQGSTTSKKSLLDVVRNLITLDYRAMTSDCGAFSIETTVSSDQYASNNDDLNCSAPVNSEAESIHPMDILNVVFNCCDGNLLQTLVEKLFQCQLSIPYIYRDMETNRSTCLLWSLRGIAPECKYDDVDQKNFTLTDIPLPVISFMRIGELKQSKSKLLNDLLRSPSHDTFFHRDCEHGESRRLLSSGTVEATWFQPSGNKNDMFQKMFCLLNLRGESTDHQEQAQLICKIASLNFVLISVESLEEKKYERFVHVLAGSQGKIVVCFVTCSPKEWRLYVEQCRSCLQYFRENGVQFFSDAIYNWTEKEIVNAVKWKRNIQSIICKYFEGTIERRTLVSLANQIRKEGVVGEQQYVIAIDEDELMCMQAHSKTHELFDRLEKINAMERKMKLLPLQGTFWKKITESQKEQYRKTVRTVNLEKHIAEKAAEQTQIRKDQFYAYQNNSRFIKDICDLFLTSNDDAEKQYFITWIKIFLNNYSREVLPLLHQHYHEQWNKLQQSLANSKDNTIHEAYRKDLLAISDQISNSSLGLEHIFREIGQAYEAVKLTPSLETVNNLPAFMADLVLNGCPLELMDGDTASVPVTWIRAVFECIRTLVRDKKVFVISIVGIQSSGKSTFLNTMFGLKFATSAGRCTKGVYCQMIPIDRASTNVDYDYLMVVDTEGLRAPELQNMSNVHDNELATFVIGLGNVTIVNIKGENAADIQDVLQIVIHAMLRIKFLSKVQLNPSCLFVHQNVPAADAEEKLKFGKENLLMLLDRVTRAAAEQENIENIQQFSQIISYDKYKHAFYLPDLWQGNPPMAPVNYGYSERIGEIKQMLIDISRKSTPITIQSFATKLTDLWRGILSENFVFNFRNSEEVRAYSLLDIFFSKLSWSLQNECLKLQKTYTVQVFSSETFTDPDSSRQQNRLKHEIVENINDKLKDFQQELNQYFDGCPNKDILEQWRERYQSRLVKVCEEEQDRILQTINEYSKLKLLQMKTNSTFEVYKNELLKEAEEKARNLKRQSSNMLFDHDLRRHFSDIWKHLVSRFASQDSAQIDHMKVILNAIDLELYRIFAKNMTVLDQELTKSPLNKLQQCNFEIPPNITIADLNLRKTNLLEKIVGFFNSSNADFKSRCLHFSQIELLQICRGIKMYIKRLWGQDFHTGHVAHIIQMATDFFTKADRSLEENGYSFKIQYQIRFTVYECKCAAVEFMKLRQFFLEKTDPLAQVREYKPLLFQVFKNAYNEIAGESTDKNSANILATCFTGWIQQTISSDHGRLITNAIVQDDNSLGSKHSFMKKMLLELLQKNHFEDFMDFLEDHDSFVIRKLKMYEELWKYKANEKEKHKTINSLVSNEVQKYLKRILKCLRKLVGPFQNVDEYLKQVENKLKNKMFIDIRVANSIQVMNFDRFTECLIRAIEDDSASIAQSVSDTILRCEFTVDLVSDKVQGCREKCPFCTAPCCLTDKNHSGDHRALQHYLFGITGMQDNCSNKLCAHNCQTLIDSDLRWCFNYNNPESTLDFFRNYKTYHSRWEIKSDRSMQTSLYWKWFMANFNAQLAQRFAAEPADIPEEWNNITVQQVMESLNNV